MEQQPVGYEYLHIDWGPPPTVSIEITVPDPVYIPDMEMSPREDFLKKLSMPPVRSIDDPWNGS